MNPILHVELIEESIRTRIVGELPDIMYCLDILVEKIIREILMERCGLEKQEALHIIHDVVNTSMLSNDAVAEKILRTEN